MRIRFTLGLPASAREVSDLLLHAAPPPPACDSAAVRVADRLGFTCESAYAKFRRPYAASMRMTRGPWSFSRLGGMWRIVPDGAQGCQLLITYNLRTTPRYARLVLEPVMAIIFYLQTCRRMRSLRAYLSKPRPPARVPIRGHQPRKPNHD